MDIAVCLITAFAAYLLGSIPSGYLAGRAKGLDIRAMGSGNIGATNAFRILGKTWGAAVLLADAFKGWFAAAMLPVIVCKIFDPALLNVPEASRDYLNIIAAISVILGHNYTCWLKFKGGKGIATSAGVLLALVPWALVISLSTWIIVCKLTRYVSVGSIAASAVLPFATWLVHRYSMRMVVITAVMGVLAIYKHKANIVRLMNGTENKMGQKRAEPEAEEMS
ncbi:MAG TPA: glycerol-3-phosphate 1-O-acyltransferase PlsY [Verrucomicrobiae bacterium]|nr:glycerol-3-phosphate 1-O-acyltransferase PlsY [Verrucomicrobiae bacterium]